MQKPGYGALKTTIAVLAIGTFSVGVMLAKKPLIDNPFIPLNPQSIKAPIIIVQEDHDICTPRDQLMKSPLMRGRIAVLELVDSTQAAMIQAYLKSANDTLDLDLNLDIYTHLSREKDAKENDHSYARMFAEAKRQNIKIEGIYCYDEPDGVWWTREWWGRRIELKDSVYAQKLFDAYSKDSVPRLFLAGGNHGKGVERWLRAHGLNAFSLVAWDSVQSARYDRENPPAPQDSAYVHSTLDKLDMLKLPVGLWKAPANYPADGAWVVKKDRATKPKMPPLKNKQSWFSRQKKPQ